MHGILKNIKSKICGAENAGLYFLTGILYIFSFPNFIPYISGGVGWLAFFCLVPFITAVDREKDLLSVLRGSFLCGWIIFLGGMYWLTEVTWLGYIILTVYMALYIVLFGMARFYNKSFIMVPLAWTGLEFIKGKLGGGIPWLLLGSSQYKFSLLIQTANITGIYGISFIVAMVNAKIARRPLAWRNLILVIGVLGAVIAYGNYEIKKPVTGEKIKMGLVQPNIPLDIKWDPQYTNWMVDKLAAISQKTVPCDILIWPETAVPTLKESVNIQKQISLMTKELNCALIVGSQGTDLKKRYYNSAFLVSRSGNLNGEYRKIHLVPFGEYVPFGENLPFLKKFTPIQGEFTAGTEYIVFNIDGISLAALICFEDIFPDLARRFVLNGANILVNITNDAWFGRSAGAYQHAVLSVFRAVENKVPLVRATNTGLSCFISPKGKILETIKNSSGNELFIEGYAVRDVVANNGNTFYTKYGNVFSWGCILILISLFGIRIIRRK